MYKPPVFYALIQVKFNPVPMARFVPDFRDALRRDGFPDYEEDTQNDVHVSVKHGVPESLESRARNRWRFLNMERTEGFTLLDDALVYHTNRYERFSHCREAMLKALRVLHEQVELAYVERIGMRYLDAVVPVAGHPVQGLVKPSLLGLHNELPGRLDHGFTETRKQVEGGKLILRVLVNEHGLALPPDLQDQTLNLDADLQSYRGNVVVMDTDYFVEKRFGFDLQVIDSQLDASHTVLIDTFKTVITDEARKLWQL